MFLRIITITLISFTMLGCANKSYTTKLSPPQERENQQKDFFSSIDNQDNLSASIGDELFVINRFVGSRKERANGTPPTGRKFPQIATWTGTYIYNDGKSGGLVVYTTPDYYDGEIGVILDKNDYLATAKPLVQVEGMKTGRRWHFETEGKFLTVLPENIDSWALRYGGKSDNQYTFEIVNKFDSKTSDILQRVKISEESFLQGFIIRNVLIEGISSDNFGVIKFKIKDTLNTVTHNNK